jgi:DNA-binding MarR family transcriptional regulator
MKSPLARRPGFLIRRLHQIFLSIYFQSCEGFKTTPAQSSIMQVLSNRPGMDQVSLAAEIGLDRTTLSNVLGRLEKRGALRRETNSEDRRNKNCFLTDEGRGLIGCMHEAIDGAHERLLAPLSEAERADFVRMLSKLVESNNDLGRTALNRF